MCSLVKVVVPGLLNIFLLTGAAIVGVIGGLAEAFVDKPVFDLIEVVTGTNFEMDGLSSAVVAIAVSAKVSEDYCLVLPS
ncbi:hypothetical protein L1987_54544 [Smallanthus sonchifolius]|uniref:Uncharacterized protein n=1 Tax=Smallanthus sonchifolius TaxID=185202 RepID=A0ACB9E727_9ASTR|nr:hypothetical protein L1987_54544 [Smallanthus sonchifolius]